ncbi:MAG: TraB/GumN family protein [Bacteroidales bacterium]|jgi:uncharacterized protein YbaP (TraB family)|nr:TraB/GumN family protein [Bacteroidales bacterium]
MKKTVLFLSLLGTILMVSAQKPTDFPNTVLWEISGNGLKKSSYILGTHHAFMYDFIDSIPGLQNVIKKTKQVAGEIDMADMQKLQFKMLQHSFMPDSLSYDKMLSQSDYLKLDDALRTHLGEGLNLYGKFSPAMLSATITQVIMMQIFPNLVESATKGIDITIQELARQKKKPVIGLETIDDQIYALFLVDPINKQLTDLICSLDHFDEMLEKSVELANYYSRFDLNAIYSIFQNEEGPCQFSEESENALIADRNNNWVIKLPDIMQSKPTLIVVGVAHLVGDDGLLYQLSQKGYSVKPIMAEHHLSK